MSLKIMYDTTQCYIALDNAGIFNGENEGFGWSTHLKKNSSVGLSGTDIEGKNYINMIFDNDMIDATINDQDFAWGDLRETF